MAEPEEKILKRSCKARENSHLWQFHSHRGKFGGLDLVIMSWEPSMIMLYVAPLVLWDRIIFFAWEQFGSARAESHQVKTLW